MMKHTRKFLSRRIGTLFLTRKTHFLNNHSRMAPRNTRPHPSRITCCAHKVTVPPSNTSTTEHGPAAARTNRGGSSGVPSTRRASPSGDGTDRQCRRRTRGSSATTQGRDTAGDDLGAQPTAPALRPPPTDRSGSDSRRKATALAGWGREVSAGMNVLPAAGVGTVATEASLPQEAAATMTTGVLRHPGRL